MLKVVTHTLLILLTFLWLPEISGQPVLPSDLKKPKQYENKLLGAEKSAEKKFRGTRKFIQNTVTHYNWYFNANNKLNQVLEAAKIAHRDDFTQLLSFYNYTLDATAASKTELDSVIYKANTGILSHDLRNTWIDNLYMLIGKAYYFRKEPDSAWLTFQYINYAFSPKEPDGYDMPIGSNANEGTNALSVATREKNDVVHKALTTPPSRNESFIWQIRTYLERDMMPEAASMIQTLKNDPVFPERLEFDLYEVQAHWFYKQKMYDSAAFYLEKALPNAADRIETSRWEYLIAQLYERANKPSLAIEFYDRARKRSLDPVLEVHAILNSIRQNSSDSQAIQSNIEELKKMGRKDRYQNYRDIIYFTAAQIELERNNIPGARAMLLKSVGSVVANPNPSQRTQSFLLLGDLSFQEKSYREAKRYYDSVNNNDPGIVDINSFEERKAMLQQLVLQMEIIQRQDSLKTLAALPEAERYALLKKMVRQLRKQQGLKDEDELSVNQAVGMNNSTKPAPDLFDNNAKGEWYFNNAALKSKGFTAFRQTWGNRPNVDNWRRAAAVVQAGRTNNAGMPAAGRAAGRDTAQAEDELSVGGLLKGIPLTPEQMQITEDSIANARVEIGKMFVDRLEQYRDAVDTLTTYVDNHPYHNRMEEALYYLYIAYRQLGEEARAMQAKNDLDKKYHGTRYQQLVNNSLTGETDKFKKEATSAYEKVYNAFIEGNFETALYQKRINDSIYGNSYWTPQLLYIESVYHLHERQDDEARKVLQNIIQVFPGDPMAAKAQNILDVLGRRKEIEDYLTKLKITRVEDSAYVVNQPAKPKEQIGTPLEQDTTRMLPMKQPILVKDSLRTPKAEIRAPALVIRRDTSSGQSPTGFSYNVEAPHTIALVLTKVDPVYVTESRNAFNRYNQQNFYNRKIDINNVSVNDTLKLMVMSGFENAAVALEYMKKTQPVIATQIVPWLPAGKYSMIIISETNLELLKSNQDINGYRKFQERYLQ